MIKTLETDAVQRALAIRDLSDPSQGQHAMQIVVSQMAEALQHKWQCEIKIERGTRIVKVADNYDRLGYSGAAVTRDGRYSRYVNKEELLRTQMSAVIPGVLRSVAQEEVGDTLLVCPGIVYRRDVIDKLHTGEPHQLDLWRISHKRLDRNDLQEMIETVVKASLPGHNWRTSDAVHPYTTEGLQIDVEIDGKWVEIGECGLASRALLRESGMGDYYGLAMGLGLDRLVMLRKGLPDIRLLRLADERVASQMLTLDPWKQVSNKPLVKRDISIMVADLSDEELGDKVREAMGAEVSNLEEIEILSRTGWELLPESARRRMGAKIGQENILLRLHIRHLEKTLTAQEANAVRDLVYQALHQGDRHEWCNNSRAL